MYPPIEPYDHGMLAVGNDQFIYWELCGSPSGKPALFLHGGPGSGCSVNSRRFFNPDLYNIVLFDQRGCGRSRPHAGDPHYDFTLNNTHFLIHDIEKLREEQGIQRWMLVGGSWGSTLALAYAQRHAQRVTQMVLFSVATTTLKEINWITNGLKMLLPREWELFSNAIPQDLRSGNLAEDYHRLLMSDDPRVHVKAAFDWCKWVKAVVALHLNQPPNPRYESPEFRLAFSRIVTYYWSNRAWLADDELLNNIYKLADVPAVLIHGRLDLGSPLITVWQLARSWTSAKLEVVEAAGHDTRDPGMTEQIIAATDNFAA